jgi:hypothetical protein
MRPASAPDILYIAILGGKLRSLTPWIRGCSTVELQIQKSLCSKDGEGPNYLFTCSMGLSIFLSGAELFAHNYQSEQRKRSVVLDDGLHILMT